MSEITRTHLTEDEMVDFAEGRLASARVAHVHECETCREQAAALRVLLSEVSDVTVPEPSPLFWSHQAKRVAEAVTRDSVGSPRPWWRWRGLSHVTTAAATATVVLAVVVGVSLLRAPGAEPTGPLETDGLGVSAPDASAMTGDGLGGSGAADWTLLLTVAESVDWREAEADLLVVDRQTVEEAVFELSDDERRTFVRLLEAELQASKGL